MARTRALLTETEAAYIAREADATENQRYQAITHVRDRLDALERDIETLEAHHPGLLAEIQDVVCPPLNADERDDTAPDTKRS